jgi:NAD(P)-dependent dehydrogenase (short-subunit alcohol dehydrogenase family)
MDRLTGKVALVTGGSSGLGRASALALSREGARVVVADVNDAGGMETVGLITGAGGEACFVKADVGNSKDVENLVREAVTGYGGLDCAFNNAGIEGPAFLTGDYPEEEWDRVIRINQKGVMLCMKYELAHMSQQGRGSIVNTSSGAGLRGLSYQSAYSTSKHALIGLTRTSAVEYARKGIRVNVICPGFINTGLTRIVLAKKPELEQKYKKLIPMGRFGREEEVAEAVVWLLSDASSFITGQALVLDGGATA